MITGWGIRSVMAGTVVEAVKADLVDLAKSVLIWIIPRQFFRFQMLRKTHEPEIALIPDLLPAGGIAIDAGANEGLWVYHLQRRAAQVVAFEPVEPLASRLQRKARENVEVRRFALSDTEGMAMLRFPRRQLAWGTIEAGNALSRSDREIVEQSVETRTLDSFCFEQVDLIKIDVEGHELAVLNGAIETIRRCQPTIVVEIENDHRRDAVSDVRRLLGAEGYNGYFLDGELRPIEDFDEERDQNPTHVGARGKSGRYINNFIFRR